MTIGKEKRKHTRVRPRGIMAHVRAPTNAFACQVENLSAGGLFLRTEQQLPRGTGLRIELVKPGSRKPIELLGLVAGVITPDEAATARLIPGLGVQFTDIEPDEANRLEELLTSLGVERPHAVVSADLRRTMPGIGQWSAGGPRSSHLARAVAEPVRDAEAVLRDINEALEAEEAPLATSKPALPPQPSGSPPHALQSQPSDAARLMMQIRGLLFQLAETQTRLRQREAELEELRRELDSARQQIDQLQGTSIPRRMN
ncbi:MAG TPA: PilZ domain-containing protein [Myxococcales bacterium]|nr:PilZ domain-containing protein [Myxococcales bacterium]